MNHSVHANRLRHMPAKLSILDRQNLQEAADHIESLEVELNELRAKIESLHNPSEEYCDKCGAPKSNHPYRHMFVAKQINKEKNDG